MYIYVYISKYVFVKVGLLGSPMTHSLDRRENSHWTPCDYMKQLKVKKSSPRLTMCIKKVKDFWQTSLLNRTTTTTGPDVSLHVLMSFAIFLPKIILTLNGRGYKSIAKKKEKESFTVDAEKWKKTHQKITFLLEGHPQITDIFRTAALRNPRAPFACARESVVNYSRASLSAIN